MKNNPICCALLLAAMPVAADEVGHWYVTPQVGGLWSDNDRNIEDEDWLYGLSVGRHLSDRWSLELNLNTARLQAPGEFDLDFRAASLDVLHVFARDRAVSPYITFGLGALRTDPEVGDHADDIIAQAGLGLFMRLWQNDAGTRSFELRPEWKIRWDDAGRDDFRDHLATIGFQFSFGPGRPAPAPEPAAAPPPPPPPPAPPPQPAPPPDSDGDGVIDPNDRCPGTRRGVAVDENGCEQRGSITLEGVSFELNSAELTVESRPILTRLAENLKKYPRLRVELQGHTDSSGSDEYNLKLSERRANAVREYLISQGVSSQQLLARGYGETQPIADNSTAEGRAQNRRVVMKVLENPGDVEVLGEE
ncbi:MAG TPA: OmpA family protein [Steroidobacteraceae bacterium]